MNDERRRSRDEMNLAVLPIARLGSSDRRTRIEYHGTFKEPGKEQEKMVWTVEGALGLPSEFAERVMIALLYIGTEHNFSDRKMTFTVYRVLKILGIAISNRNYRLVEAALKQIAGLLITSDKAWVERTGDGKQKRVTTSRGFHLIDEYSLHYQDGAEEGGKSFVVWGSLLWKSIQAGYLKMLDIDFYFQIENPVARRLYRFLDKMMGYDPAKPYQIDIFDLSNKLGMAPYEQAAHLRRPLKIAAQELVDRGYLYSFEFVKAGPFSRIRFYRSGQAQWSVQQPLLPFTEPTSGEPTTNVPITKTPEEELWASLFAELSPAHAELLQDASLVRLEEGVAVIAVGRRADWLQNRLARPLQRTLKHIRKDITDVQFVNTAL